eukprot:g9029.t1
MRGQLDNGIFGLGEGWYPDPATSFLCGPKRTWSSFTGDLGSAQAMPGYGQQGNIQQGYQDSWTSRRTL